MFRFREYASYEKLAFARKMRKNPTPSERLLWSKLKKRQIGFRFKRQQFVLGWIVDFYCPKRRLVVEIDGPSHDRVKDARRDAIMTNHGFRVIRFTNDEVKTKIAHVVGRLWNKIAA